MSRNREKILPVVDEVVVDLEADNEVFHLSIASSFE